jgi:glycosidase
MEKLPGADRFITHNRRDFPGGWKEDVRNAFEASGRSADEQGVFAHLRHLARLRQELPGLRRGRLVTLAAGEQTYAYARVGEGPSVILAFNNGKEPADFDLEARAAALDHGVTLEDRLGTLGAVSVTDGRLRLRVPARTAGLLVPTTP